MIKFNLKRSGLILGLMTLIVALSPKAQAQVAEKLPIDKAIRMGKLDNGLTYFIRHNQKPEGRAEFYIAQKVGSMLEKDSQSGLAHFLEHMAFNGTKNFPDKGILNWLETKGVTFGSEINAYTSFDETVYTLMRVPSKEQQVVDSCILILHDWSNAITLADKEIDNERGVIQEEWRSRDNGFLRAFLSICQQSVPSTQYGERFPIGSMDVVRNFKYKELRDYYKKWYRPDLQGIMIVGDVDVDKVEASIKRIFADIPKPVNPAERIYAVAAKVDSTVVAVATDPEIGAISLGVQYRMEVLPENLKGTLVDYSYGMVKYLASYMLRERFAEIMQAPNPPFLSASFGLSQWGQVVYNTEAATFSLSVKDKDLKGGLDALVREIKRVQEYGFTQGELERAKKDYLVGAKKSYDERKNKKSHSYIEEMKDYFLEGGFLLDPEMEYMIDQAIESIPLEGVNDFIKTALKTKEILLTYIGPKKDEFKTPTKAELKKMFETAFEQKVEAYKDEVSDTKLMEEMPKAGKVIKEETGKFGSKIWTLSNGSKVIFKQTDLKEDEIRMTGSRLGGTFRLRGQVDDLTLNALPAVMNLGGLAKFNQNALSKALTGRIASAYMSIGGTTDNVGGSSTKADLETMLQLLHLNFTAKRRDLDAFKTWQERSINAIKATKANPMSGLSDTIAKLAFPGEDYRLSLTEEQIKAIDYKKVMDLQDKLFAGVKDFTFVFVGNIEEDKFRPLVETYIASLPEGKKNSPVPFDKVKGMRQGQIIHHYEKEMTTPMGLVLNLLSGKIKNNLRNDLLSSVLGEVLTQSYTESIREKEGGTYGVGVNASLERRPYDGYMTLVISFQTEPSKAEHLNGLVLKELDNVAKNGVNPAFFDKTIQSMLKARKEALKENGYWLGQLSSYYAGEALQLDWTNGYDELVKSLKKEEVQGLLKQFLAQGNRLELILRPKAAKK